MHINVFLLLLNLSHVAQITAKDEPHHQHHDDDNEAAAMLTRKNLMKIKVKFGRLVTLTSKKLQNEEIDIEETRLFLISTLCDNNKSFAAELGMATNFTNLFGTITTHGVWSYNNYDLLECIINEYVPELCTAMTDYQKDYVGYTLTTKIEDHIDAVATIPDSENSHPDPELFSRLETRIHIKLSERTLKYIDELWKSLSMHFVLKPYLLLLDKVMKGSITITWCFPQYETKRIIEIVKSSSQFFSEHDIVEVSIDGEIAYPTKTDTLLEVRRHHLIIIIKIIRWCVLKFS